MSDEFDVYGDADMGDDAQGDGVADPAATASGSAGDGLPGYPMESHPDWRAGAFGSGRGLLGLIKVSNPANPVGDEAMPPAYMPDGRGGVRLRPDFAATHPEGPFDFAGMSKEIDWPGVALDLGAIPAGSLPLVGAKGADVLKAIPGWGIDVWRELHHDAQPGKDQAKS